MSARQMNLHLWLKKRTCRCLAKERNDGHIRWRSRTQASFFSDEWFLCWNRCKRLMFNASVTRVCPISHLQLIHLHLNMFLLITWVSLMKTITHTDCASFMTDRMSEHVCDLSVCLNIRVFHRISIYCDNLPRSLL